ncbi:MAG TPA: hypothetical protein PKC43_06755 [Phycisphaerales bacterium]|nr:hypothetical protein [Phycisphaerales bacterium]HMP37132.1 hypothetical protein [Phycisphaerales bacterium]
MPRAAPILLAALFALGAAPEARSDEVAAWLERRGLVELLAAHLEERLEAARDLQQREQVAARLARVYARMLESGVGSGFGSGIGSGGERSVAEIERRGRQLLGAVAGAEAEELRLALLGASHRAAARIAERRRLALDAPGECETARATLARIVPELRDLRSSLRRTQAELQRRVTRAAGVEATLLIEKLERAQRHAAQASYLNGWTLYYLAWIGDCSEGASEVNRDLVREAKSAFLEIIDAVSAAPRPEEVSLDMRRHEHYARAILGVALCLALEATPSAADAWIDLLEAPSTWPPLLAELPAWRLAALLDGRRYLEAREHFEAMLAAGDPEVPQAWLRLAVARSIDGTGRSRHAAELARRGVGALAARGEIAQVLDLARRFDRAELFDAAGFVMRYVRGLRAFEQARAHPEPAEGEASQAARALYSEASTELLAAIHEPDAAGYGDAVGAAEALVAWCHWYRGELGAAAVTFERAADAQRGENSAEALWMAIAATDRLARAGDRAAEARLVDLIDRFLQEHPGSPRVPRLLLRRSFSVDRPTPQLVDRLLAVPAGSEEQVLARRRAVQVLYELYRSSSAADQAEWARRLVAVGESVVGDDAARLERLDAAERTAHLVRVRQVVEASLDPSLGRSDLALRLLDELDALAGAGSDELAGARSELAFRRIQALLAAASERGAALDPRTFAEAESIALAISAAEDPWSLPMARLLFRTAVERLRAEEQAGGVDAAGAEAAPTRWMRSTFEWGRRALANHDPRDPAALAEAMRNDARLVHGVRALGEVAAAIAEAERDAELARDGAGWLEAVLLLRPTDSAALRSAAIASAVAEDHARAVEHARTLAAGLSIGAPGWYEAKWRLVASLAKLDPKRARAVLEQHRALDPALGPSPWGERLRELDRVLPPSVARGEGG